MKHPDLFRGFLSDTVNLNDTRVKDLETSIEAIKNAVRGSDWKPHFNGWMAHGSWAHKTIIKPVDSGEFDADLIVFIEHVDGWTAATYIDELYRAFRANPTYRDMVNRSSHCVTVSYANDKKIDVAPCVTNRTNALEVCNRTEDRFEQSEPKQYTEWLIEKNRYCGNNNFRKVTRLVKYLRDIKERFKCSSVLLTTILGYMITEADEDSNEFDDTATALKTIFGRMDDELQTHATKPSVPNPFLSSEDFADVWTEEQFTNFRDKIHTYREWIDDAYNEQDRSESIAKWRRVFGEEFAKSVANEEGKSVSKAVVASVRANLAEASQFTGDLVEAIKRFGAKVLPASFDKKPYMEAPKWKSSGLNMPVVIRADLHRNSYGTQRERATQPLEPLPPGYWLHFKAVTNTGLPFDASQYKVMWRVAYSRGPQKYKQEIDAAGPCPLGARSGLNADIAPCPKSADIVAKVPKGAAANFPPNDETSNNRRSMVLQTRYRNRLCVLCFVTWSPASLFNRCTYGSENVSPASQKHFCNNICQRRTFK